MGVNPSKFKPEKVDYSPQEKSILSTPGLTKEIQTGTIDPQKLQNLLPETSNTLKRLPQFDEAVDQSFDLSGLTNDLKSVKGPSLEDVFSNSQKKNQKLAMEVQREEQVNHESNGDLLDTEMLQNTDPLSTQLDEQRRNSLLLTDLKKNVHEESHDNLQESISHSLEDTISEKHSLLDNQSESLEDHMSSQHNELSANNDHLSTHQDNLSPNHDVEDLTDEDTDKGLNVSKEMENELLALDNLMENPEMREDDLVKLEQNPHNLSEHSSLNDVHSVSNRSHHDSILEPNHVDKEDLSSSSDLQDHHGVIDSHELSHSTELNDHENQSPLDHIDHNDIVKNALVKSGHPQLNSMFEEHHQMTVEDEIDHLKNDQDIQNLGLTEDMSPEDELALIENKLSSGELQHHPEVRKKVEEMLKAQREVVQAIPAKVIPNTGVKTYKSFKHKKLVKPYKRLKEGQLPIGTTGIKVKKNNGTIHGVMPDGKRKFNNLHYNKMHGAENRTHDSFYGNGGLGMVKKAQLMKMDRKKGKLFNKFLKI
jgi:hypothetical protein